MRTIKLLSLLVATILLVSLFAGCSNDNDSNPSSDMEASAPVADEGDSYEEGTSLADGIINTTPAEKVILVVSFGTSFIRAAASPSAASRPLSGKPIPITRSDARSPARSSSTN